MIHFLGRNLLDEELHLRSLLRDGRPYAQRLEKKAENSSRIQNVVSAAIAVMGVVSSYGTIESNGVAACVFCGVNSTTKKEQKKKRSVSPNNVWYYECFEILTLQFY